MIQIVSDSCCDLPPVFLAQYPIHIVPLPLQIGEEQYWPGVDLGMEQALAKIAAANMMPSTSQPPPAAYEAVFQTLQTEGPILCFTISSKLSGSFQSANLAAKNCGGDITVWDTLQGSCAQGFQVLLAASLAAEGKTVPEILQALEAYVSQSSIVIILKRYDRAMQSGRINKVVGSIGQKLNIRALLEVVDGKIIIVDKARGEEKICKKMMQRIGAKSQNWQETVIGIAHFNCLDLAKFYQEKLIQQLQPKEFYLATLNPTIGVYADVGGLVFSIAPCPFTFGRE